MRREVENTAVEHRNQSMRAAPTNRQRWTHIHHCGWYYKKIGVTLNVIYQKCMLARISLARRSWMVCKLSLNLVWQRRLLWHYTGSIQMSERIFLAGLESGWTRSCVCVFISVLVMDLWWEGDRIRCVLPLTSCHLAWVYLPGFGLWINTCKFHLSHSSTKDWIKRAVT